MELIVKPEMLTSCIYGPLPASWQSVYTQM